MLKDEGVQAAGTPSERAVLGTQVMNGLFVKQAVADGLVTMSEEGYELRTVSSV